MENNNPNCDKHPGFCWYCSIPPIILAKLALMDVTLGYAVAEDTTVIMHPTLIAASAAREHSNALLRQGLTPTRPVLPPIKAVWRVRATKMTPEKWQELVCEIADAVAEYHYSFMP